MVTEVRQRVTREQLGRRGRKTDPAWAHRRLLLAAGNRLGRHGRARLRAVFAADPTQELGAAWGIKELLRQLLAAPSAHDARHRLSRFYEAVLAADMPEPTRLAETISTWWPEIEAFLRLRVTNARTEGGNASSSNSSGSAAATEIKATTNAVSSCTSPPRTRRDSDQRGGHFTLHREEPLWHAYTKGVVQY